MSCGAHEDLRSPAQYARVIAIVELQSLHLRIELSSALVSRLGSGIALVGQPVARLPRLVADAGRLRARLRGDIALE
ncbi:MAG: hypothetical protein WKF96_14265 [Solirubrobacteraceae bacterium]